MCVCLAAGGRRKGINFASGHRRINNIELWGCRGLAVSGLWMLSLCWVWTTMCAQNHLRNLFRLPSGHLHLCHLCACLFSILVSTNSSPTQTLAHIRVCTVHHVGKAQDISRLRERHVEIPVALRCDLLMASHPRCGSCFLSRKLVASHRYIINCPRKCCEKPRCSDEGATSHRHIACDNVTSRPCPPRYHAMSPGIVAFQAA